jgi:hypothetical protein
MPFVMASINFLVVNNSLSKDQVDPEDAGIQNYRSSTFKRAESRYTVNVGQMGRRKRG